MVVSIVCGIKGGYARHPCPYCTYNAQKEAPEEHRDWDHYCMSFDGAHLSEFVSCYLSEKP